MQPHHPHRRALRNGIGFLLAVLVVVVIVVIMRALPSVFVMTRQLRAVESNVAQAHRTWEQKGIRGSAEIALALHSAERALARASETAESLPLLRTIPFVRGVLLYAEQVSSAGRDWMEGAAIFADMAQRGTALYDEFADRALKTISSEERRALVAEFGDVLLRSRHARSVIERGTTALQTIRCPWTLRLLRSCVSFNDAESVLDGAQEKAIAVLDIAENIASLVGAHEPRSVLLLFLNNTELRPGGGFLGTYGIATVHEGALVDFQTDDVYNLDRFVEGTQRIVPPAPFRDHGIVTYWYLRDANWSPDFLTSSESVLDFYRRENGPGNPSIVIGFTPSLAAALLDIVGPVTIDGTTFRSENIADELEYQVELGYYERGIPRPQRKAIIASLSRAVIDRLLMRPLRTWRPIVDSVRTAVAERQLMAYATEPALQASFDAFDLSGRIAPLAAGEDGLVIVDANLGALKTDPVMQRAIHYAIIPDGAGGYRGTIALRYKNTGTFTWKTTRYRTYTRVYLPAGTKLIRAHGAMERDRSDAPGPVDSGVELGRQVFGAFLSVEPGEERSLVFEIQLAPAVAERLRMGGYTFIAQKQLGSLATPLTIDLSFGTPVRTANPPEVPAAWGDNRYQLMTDLRVDRSITVALER